MSKKVKDIASYILIGIVILVTLTSILSIWDIISLEDILQKTSKSLFVVFVAALIILFISSVLINPKEKPKY